MERSEKSVRERRYSQHEKTNPSFSSTLLDAIYRSIDDECHNGGELIIYRETSTRKKNSSSESSTFQERKQHKEIASIRRSCMIEHWVENQGNVKLRKTSDFEDSFQIFNSTSSSSESSFGGFSSSEAESIFTSQRPKLHQKEPQGLKKQNNKLENQDQRTKKASILKSSKARAASKATYAELKKVKLPISPGGRLATFLNSIFATRNTKKAKISTASAASSSEDFSLERNCKSVQASTCSSATSYYRSCLSKASSKASNGVKRSVSFYPVSIIFDEDCRPCGQKCLNQEEDKIRPLVGDDLNLKFHLMEKSKRVEEAAKVLLKNYKKKSKLLGEVMRDVHKQVGEDEDYDDYDDDASDSSSDLFELENLASISSVDRYRKELPVYETTNINGFDSVK